MPGFQVAGDIELNENATDLKWVSGELRVLQEIKAGITVFRDLYRYDLNAGLPYRESIMISAPSLAEIRAIFYDFFLSITGVVTVEYVRLEIDQARRHLNVDFRLVLERGTVESQIPLEF